jgi:DeoR/GlpR family transcriptional regulator of sugar metabolism
MDQLNEKSHIGAKAASLIQDGETVFLGSGTTVLEAAHRLPHRQNLTIITNSLPVANVLATRTDINLVILGGIFRHSECTAYGHFTEQALAELHADKVIFGIRAISSAAGLTNDFIPEVQTDRSILKIGREVIIVADHTKFNAISTATVAPLSWVSKIITDNLTPADVIDEMTELGIEMIVVDCCAPLPSNSELEHAAN